MLFIVIKITKRDSKKVEKCKSHVRKLKIKQFYVQVKYRYVSMVMVRNRIYITKTYLYDFDPLKPHFCIVKLGFTGVCIIFLISAQKHRLWVRVRIASPRRF